MRRTARGFSLTVVAVCAASSARAVYVHEEPYRFSAEFCYDHSDKGGNETAVYRGTVAVYSPKVERGREPIAEGVFGQRISALELSYGLFLYGGELVGLEVNGDGDVYGAGARASHMSFPVALEFTFTGTVIEDAEIELLGTLDKYEQQDYDGRVVLYLAPRSAAFVGYRLQALELNGIPPFSLDAQEDTATLSFAGKHLASLRGEKWLNVEGGASHVSVNDYNAATPDPQNWEYHINADYYPDRLVGFGMGFALNDGEQASAEGLTYKARITYNHGSQFGMRLEFEQFEIRDPAEGEDETKLSISIIFRG